MNFRELDEAGSMGAASAATQRGKTPKPQPYQGFLRPGIADDGH